ncbi:hypothetical protein HDU78_010155 [Chytriomyces hyalinus]|nr:hypothetical protein HDU78_010155 [Chytriomyces hyalinus]
MIAGLIAAIGGVAVANNAVGVARRAANQAERVGNNFIYKFGSVADKAVEVGNVQLTEFNANLDRFVKVGDNAVQVIDRRTGQVLQTVARASDDVIRIVDRSAAEVVTMVDARAGDVISVVGQALEVVDQQFGNLNLQVGEFLQICDFTVRKFDIRTQQALQTIQLSADAILTLMNNRSGEAIEVFDRRAEDFIQVAGMAAFFGVSALQREIAHAAALGYTLGSLFLYGAFTAGIYLWTLDIAPTAQLLVALVVVHHSTLYFSMARLRKLDKKVRHPFTVFFDADALFGMKAIACDGALAGPLSETSTDAVPTSNVEWVPGGECPAWLSLAEQKSLLNALKAFQYKELAAFQMINKDQMTAVCNYLQLTRDDQNSFSVENVKAVIAHYK